MDFATHRSYHISLETYSYLNETHSILLIFLDVPPHSFHYNCWFLLQILRIKQFFFFILCELCSILRFHTFISVPKFIAMLFFSRVSTHIRTTAVHRSYWIWPIWMESHIVVPHKIPMVVRVPRAHVIIDLNSLEISQTKILWILSCFCFHIIITFHLIQEANLSAVNPMRSTWKLLIPLKSLP